MEKDCVCKLRMCWVSCWETVSCKDLPVLTQVIMAEAPTSESVALGQHKQTDVQETPLQKTESSSLKPSWREITFSFVMRTKVHGLKFIFSPDKSKPQRVIWVMAFFLCISLLCTWSWNRIFYLMSYPAVTKIYMVWAHNMSFPAVTFCNKNVFRVSTLTKEDLYHSGYWMDLMYSNHTVMEKSMSILRDSHKQGLLSLLDFNNYSPHPNYRINTTEMMGRLGHQLEEMLLECRFRGETCNHKNFSTVCTKRKMVFARCGCGCCLQGVLIIHRSIWLRALQHAFSEGVLWCCFKAAKKLVLFLSLHQDSSRLIKHDAFKIHSEERIQCYLFVVVEKDNVMAPSVTLMSASLKRVIYSFATALPCYWDPNFFSTFLIFNLRK